MELRVFTEPQQGATYDQLLAVARRAEDGDFSGTHYTVTSSPALPKPVQRPRPPVIIGGFGPKRTPRLVARFADEFNAPFCDAEVTAGLNATIDATCEAADRDPATVIRSAAQVLCCGADQAEIAHRAGAIGRDVDELRTNGLAGTPDELVAKLEAFAEVGVTRVYLQVLDLADLDHLDLVAEAVLPAAATLPGS